MAAPAPSALHSCVRCIQRGCSAYPNQPHPRAWPRHHRRLGWGRQGSGRVRASDASGAPEHSCACWPMIGCAWEGRRSGSACTRFEPCACACAPCVGSPAERAARPSHLWPVPETAALCPEQARATIYPHTSYTAPQSSSRAQLQFTRKCGECGGAGPCGPHLRPMIASRRRGAIAGAQTPRQAHTEKLTAPPPQAAQPRHSAHGHGYLASGPRRRRGSQVRGEAARARPGRPGPRAPRAALGTPRGLPGADGGRGRPGAVPRRLGRRPRAASDRLGALAPAPGPRALAIGPVATIARPAAAPWPWRQPTQQPPAPRPLPPRPEPPPTPVNHRQRAPERPPLGLHGSHRHPGTVARAMASAPPPGAQVRPCSVMRHIAMC